MKRKLRKIVVGDSTYLYRIGQAFVATDEGHEDYWEAEVVVYLTDHKQTPFELVLLGRDEYATGNVLTGGLLPGIRGAGTDRNLHRPGVVRRVIEEALAMGWTGDQQAMRMAPGFPGYEALVKRLGLEGVVWAG